MDVTAHLSQEYSIVVPHWRLGLTRRSNRSLPSTRISSCPRDTARADRRKSQPLRPASFLRWSCTHRRIPSLDSVLNGKDRGHWDGQPVMPDSVVGLTPPRIFCGRSNFSFNHHIQNLIVLHSELFILLSCSISFNFANGCWGAIVSTSQQHPSRHDFCNWPLPTSDSS
jgi:hypothetical protein